MKRINSRKLLVGISLVAAGVIVIGVGVAIGGSVGGAIIATAAAAA
jgi:hypothetical protein